MHIRPIEMRFLDDLFNMRGGYVLDFSNRTFDELFQHEVGVDIYDDVYSTNGSSKAKRFRTFLQVGQTAAVIRALRALWEYRETAMRRAGGQENIRGARDDLSAIIERLGGRPLAKPPKSGNTDRRTPNVARISQLAESFLAISALDPQPRGYAFERFLKDMFDAYGLEAREAFRLVGEQIDGSFQLADETYLLEARWQNTRTDVDALRSFNGKVEDKSAWTRGLFVSYVGFSEQGLAAFKGNRIVLMDGLDLHDSLRLGLSVADVIALKVRRAAESGRIFIRVRDLIPE